MMMADFDRPDRFDSEKFRAADEKQRMAMLTAAWVDVRDKAYRNHKAATTLVWWSLVNLALLLLALWVLLRG